MVLRLLLGFAETAFAPGVTFYLSFFYNRREIGFRQGYVLETVSTGSRGFRFTRTD